MNNINKKNIVIITDFEKFKTNINKIILPIEPSTNYIFIDQLNNLDAQLNNLNADLIIINKASYTEDEIKSILYSNSLIEKIVIIDSYFKYDKLFTNFKNGIITVRRPMSINSFIEILKVCLFSINKRRKYSDKKIGEFEIIDYAKILLILYKKLSEDESHKYLERNSMELRVPLVKISQNIIIDYLKEKENIKYENKN